MTHASKSPFLFPLLPGDLAEFSHPSNLSPLSAAHIIDGCLTTGNGYIAIKANRGRWMDSDFQPASQKFIDRFSTLPWNTDIANSTEWRPLDAIRQELYRSAPISLWTEQPLVAGAFKLSPSPVWKVGANQLIRLSFLQLLARLPRCEVWAGRSHPSEPIRFRFNAGVALVPRDHRLTLCSKQIFRPVYHSLTGERQDPSTRARPSFGPNPPPEPPMDNWPPPTPQD